MLLTGATGTLGRLAAVALLRDESVEVVAPVRNHHGPDALVNSVGRELSHGRAFPARWADRLHQIALPEGTDDPGRADPLVELDDAADRFQVDEVLHAAGCLSYFDEKQLHAVNVEMTRRFVEAARRWNVRRFVHVSTAFASGVVDGPIPEALHCDPPDDPTPYTRTKRQAEHIVANGGVPFLIVRPSIVIGDSRTGRYEGPRYGIYQLLSGVERFLLDEWSPDVHYVAPDQHAALIHQDAFQSGLIAARRLLPDNTIIHLTSRGGPGFRELADIFIHDYIRPETAYFYDHLSDIALHDIPMRQRAFLRLASTNIAISSRPWDFATDTLDALVEGGVDFADTATESVKRCLDTYLARSDRLTRYTERYAASFPERVLIERVTSNSS